MICPICGSENVTVKTERVGSDTRHNGGRYTVSLARAIIRVLLICCTCGLWLLVPKRLTSYKSKSTRSYTYQTICTCHACGYAWKTGQKLKG